MLTVDSDELRGLNYTGFSERKISFIKETFVLFQNVNYSDEGQDWNWIKFDGTMFGNGRYVYWIYKAKSGIHIQVATSLKPDYPLFGAFITTTSEGKKEFAAYHTDQKYGIDDEL